MVFNLEGVYSMNGRRELVEHAAFWLAVLFVEPVNNHHLKSVSLCSAEQTLLDFGKSHQTGLPKCNWS